MGVVQGSSPDQHGVMAADWWLGGLFPSGSVYALLPIIVGGLFPDAIFADLFPSHLGRPSVPAEVVTAVLVLQALEGRSDREAAEALNSICGGRPPACCRSPRPGSTRRC